MKTSKRVALGGVFSALSLLMMFLSGVFPFAEYTCPAIAGIMLIPLVIEINKKTAYIAYVIVAVLSVFIVPNKEAAVLFVVILGYYPVLKSTLEKIKNRKLEFVVKLVAFNVALVIAYIVLIYFLGMTELVGEFNSFIKYGIIVFWVLANVAFVLYDYALTGLIGMYLEKIRPKIKKLY